MRKCHWSRELNETRRTRHEKISEESILDRGFSKCKAHSAFINNQGEARMTGRGSIKQKVVRYSV